MIHRYEDGVHDVCIWTTAGIFLSMIVAHYTDAEMMKNGVKDSKGDVLAGHWLGHHAGLHDRTLHPGGFVEVDLLLQS